MTKRRTRLEWERLVSAWRQSGLEVGEFCRRRRLSASTFAWWRWRLGARGEVADAAGFAELTVVEARSTTDGGQSCIKVLLPGDVVVLVERGFDEGTLARVVTVLNRGSEC